MDNLSIQKNRNVNTESLSNVVGTKKKYLIILILILFSAGSFYLINLFSRNKDKVSDDKVSNFDSENSPFKRYVEDQTEQIIYEELGMVMESNEEQLLVYKKDLSERARFEKPENRNQFSTDVYNVIDIPSQSSIKYVVGTFVNWEDIDGTNDKYIVIRYAPLYHVIKFRVSFEESDLFSSDVTVLLCESIALDESHISQCGNEYADFISMGFQKASSIIKEGDIVRLLPLFEPPEYNKTDDLGNYLASKVYIRKDYN